MAANERDVEGRCDNEGYLLDMYANKVFSDQMKQRLMKRKNQRAKTGNKPKPDEKYAIVDGQKIEGHYEKSGEFVVAPAFRA